MQAVRDAGTLPGRLPLFLFSFFYYNLSRAELQAFLRTLPVGKIGAASRSLTRPRPARKRGRGACFCSRRGIAAGTPPAPPARSRNRRQGSVRRFCSRRMIAAGTPPAPLARSGNRRQGFVRRFCSRRRIAAGTPPAPHREREPPPGSRSYPSFPERARGCKGRAANV